MVSCYDRVRGRQEREVWRCSRVRPKPRWGVEKTLSTILYPYEDKIYGYTVKYTPLSH